MTAALAWVAVAGAGVALAYRWRRRVLLLCLLVVAAVPAFGLAVVTTGGVAPDLLMRAATIAVATVILSVVTVLLVTCSLPRLRSRRDRHGVAVACSTVAAMYAAVALFLAVAATDEMQVAELPVLRDRDAFIAWRDAPQAAGGVLLEGRISQHSPELTPQSDLVATHSCLDTGTQRIPLPGHRLPDRYLVAFPGGPPLVVDGIGSGTQAWRWPPSTGECVLRRGDRIVVWGELQGGMGGGTTSHTGLSNVHVIAVGDAATFLNQYVPAAEHTARAVLALAALNVALAVAVTVCGVRAYRRLAHTGTDDPPQITWRTGPR